MRQALDCLEIEQRIYRQQGRGTFVAKPKIDQTLELSSHTENIRARGMEPASRLIGITRAPAEADVAGMLALAEGDEVFQIERVRLADDEPLAVELLFLDARRFDDIAAVLGESRSLYQLLRARYGVELASAEETIEAVAVAEREADLLGIPVGAPVLLLSRQSFDSNQRPVEFVRSVYRADRFRFRTRLQPSPPKQTSPLPAGTRLRLATVADAPALAAVFVSAWRGGYGGIVPQGVLDALDERDIADWLGTLTSSNGPTTWVVESSSGEIAAFSRHGADPSDNRRGHIYSLYVAPASSGQGIAKALLGPRPAAALQPGPRHGHALGLRGEPRRAQPLRGLRLRPRRRTPRRGPVRDPGDPPTAQRHGPGAREHTVSRPPEGEISFTLSDKSDLLDPRAAGAAREYLVSLSESRFPPGFSLAVLDGSGVVLEAFAGHSCVVGETLPTTPETRYDLASLTKVVCTVTLALVARQRGLLGLDEHVVNYLPRFPEKSTTMRHLLTHTSGLVDHRPFFRTSAGRDEVEAALYDEAAGCPPGDAVRLLRSQLHAPRLGARGVLRRRPRRGVRLRGGAPARDVPHLFLPARV